MNPLLLLLQQTHYHQFELFYLRGRVQVSAIKQQLKNRSKKREILILEKEKNRAKCQSNENGRHNHITHLCNARETAILIGTFHF